jgi:hypothetical protein
MTDRKQERKPGKNVNKSLKVDKLEISKETVQDLSDTQAERVEGGAAADKRVGCPHGSCMTFGGNGSC